MWGKREDERRGDVERGGELDGDGEAIIRGDTFRVVGTEAEAVGESNVPRGRLGDAGKRCQKTFGSPCRDEQKQCCHHKVVHAGRLYKCYHCKNIYLSK